MGSIAYVFNLENPSGFENMRNLPCQNADCLEVNVSASNLSLFLRCGFRGSCLPTIVISQAVICVLIHFENVENYVCLSAKGKYPK